MPLHSKKRKASGSEDGHSQKIRKSHKAQMKIGEMFSSNVRQVHSSKPQSEPFSFKKCLRWFKEYAENDQIEPEGMEELCKAIGVQPDDIVMLILAQKLNAQNMGFFTLEEWTKGMQSLQCDCTAKLRGKMSSLRASLDDPSQFKIIYRYAFDFAKEIGQRTLDIETAKAMLDLLLSNKWVLYPRFQNFIKENKCKAINRDQWNNILEFSKSVLPDLSNYDMDGAWPVLMDEFVEFLKTQNEDA